MKTFNRIGLALTALYFVLTAPPTFAGMAAAAFLAIFAILFCLEPQE